MSVNEIVESLHLDLQAYQDSLNKIAEMSELFPTIAETCNLAYITEVEHTLRCRFMFNDPDSLTDARDALHLVGYRTVLDREYLSTDSITYYRYFITENKALELGVAIHIGPAK